jgi:alpha-tubulin suppressor-like RCC1 family protein
MVVGGITFASVVAGDSHTCGLTSAGRAYCWGNGAVGRLGIGLDFVAPLVPTSVAGDLTFTSISAGVSHTCGVTNAGLAYCWGDGTYGRLGNGSTANRLTPTPVSGDLSFVSISAGYFHSCGITTAGHAYCWGDNEFGQLGIGWAAPNSPQATPKAVETNLTFAGITVSAYQTCALTTLGRAYCWGSGDSGRLGTGSTANQSTPTPVASGLTFTSITTGYVHGCALEAVTGQAYCWGDATYGQIGTGSTTSQLVPTPVAGGLKFAGLSAGYLHTCGVTAGTGQYYCWGSNNSGRLGTGTPGNELAPAPVAPLP